MYSDLYIFLFSPRSVTRSGIDDRRVPTDEKEGKEGRKEAFGCVRVWPVRRRWSSTSESYRPCRIRSSQLSIPACRTNHKFSAQFVLLMSLNKSPLPFPETSLAHGFSPSLLTFTFLQLAGTTVRGKAHAYILVISHPKLYRSLDWLMRRPTNQMYAHTGSPACRIRTWTSTGCNSPALPGGLPILGGTVASERCLLIGPRSGISHVVVKKPHGCMHARTPISHLPLIIG